VIAVVAAFAVDEFVVVLCELQRGRHFEIRERPVAVSVVEVVAAVLQKDSQGLALRFANQRRIDVAAANVREAADMTQHLAYTIVTAAASSADARYDGLDAADVSVTNVDDDTAGITVSAISGNTTESGGTATFSVVLNTQPTADVTIGLSSSAPTEGTVGVSSLLFTSANWNVAQQVTVTGVDDQVDDGDVAYTIVTAAASSADPRYDGLDANDVSVTNVDDDVLVDVTPPVSIVDALSRRQTSKTFSVSVVGSDPIVGGYASGISYFAIYTSVQGGPWQWWTNVLPISPTADYTAQSNQSIGFFSIGVDLAGNVESKTPHVEAGTYIPDVDAPVTQVDSVDTADATFELAFSGTDSGGSSLSFFDVFVSIDDAAPVKIGRYNAGTANGSGVYHGSTVYQAIADGAEYTYRFYTVGIDGGGNTEVAPADPNDVKKSATFATPSALQVTAFDVQKNALQRSFVRYLDVTFNQCIDLRAMIASVNDGDTSNDRIKLLRFGLDGTGSGQEVGLANRIAAVDQIMAFDFGAQGIGGNQNSNAGDGYYKLLLDLDGDGDFDDEGSPLTFYRLFGDVNADRIVDNLDIGAITAAFGRTGNNLNEDVNGDGVVNALDRLFANLARGRRLDRSLPLSD